MRCTSRATSVYVFSRCTKRGCRGAGKELDVVILVAQRVHYLQTKSIALNNQKILRFASSDKNLIS